MPLVERHTVKARFTYKELTLVLGIFVALIIALTLWSGSYRNLFEDQSGIIPAISVPQAMDFVVKAVSLFQP